MRNHDPREHARAFLGRIDKDIAVRHIALVFRQSESDVRTWKSGELRRWCFEQAARIAGTESAEAIVQNQDILTLTALGYLALAEIDDLQPPTSPAVPVPARLGDLEEGFLKALLEEAKRDEAASPQFHNRLEEAKSRVTRLAQSLEGAAGAEPPPPRRGTARAQATSGGWKAIDLLAVICAIAGVVAKLTKKKSK